MFAFKCMLPIICVHINYYGLILSRNDSNNKTEFGYSQIGGMFSIWIARFALRIQFLLAIW